MIELIIHYSLVPQLLEELADICANLERIGSAKFGLQFFYKLPERALPVAALQHLPSRPLKLYCTLGKQEHALRCAARITLRRPAASCR